MLERKGLGIRIGAAAIDVVAMSVAASIISVIVGLGVPRLAGLCAFAVVAGYAYVEVLKGQSPGKMALSLKVARDDGSPVTQDQLLHRTAIKYSPLLIRFGIAAVTGLVGLWPVSLAGGIVGALASLGLSIFLIVKSWDPMQTVRQAYWDLYTHTAVFGPPAAVPVGFAPAMPGQPVPPVPPNPSATV